MLTSIDEKPQKVTKAYLVVGAKGRRLTVGYNKKVEWSPGMNVWRGKADTVRRTFGEYPDGWHLPIRKPKEYTGSACRCERLHCIPVALEDVVATGQGEYGPMVVARRVIIGLKCYSDTAEAIADISGPERLVQAVRGPSRRRSWRFLNSALHHAMRIAIELHMEFYPDDYERIYSSQDGHFWLHTEGHYTRAVTESNLSAARSIEQWRGREPFIWHGKRLYVGAQFEWEGMTAKVTSFNDAEGYLVACGGYSSEFHHQRKPGERGKRQFKITPAELRAVQKESKP